MILFKLSKILLNDNFKEHLKKQFDSTIATLKWEYFLRIKRKE